MQFNVSGPVVPQENANKVFTTATFYMSLGVISEAPPHNVIGTPDLCDL